MQGITFHYFTDSLNDNLKTQSKFVMCQGALTSEQFEEMILYLKKNYILLGAKEYLSKLQNKECNEKTVCLTFDDGLKSQYEIAWPVMKKYNLTGFFFVNTCWMEGKKSLLEIFHDFRFRMFSDVEQFYSEFFAVLDKNNILNDELKIKFNNFDYNNYLKHCTWHTYTDKLFRYTRDQLLTEQQYIEVMLLLMKAKKYDIDEYADLLWINEADLIDLDRHGNVIGLHTHTHPTNMKRLSYHEKENEYKKNQDILSGILKKNIEVASYPCGYCDSETEDIMKKLGVKYGFLAHSSEDCNLLNLSRINHPQIVDKMRNERIS